MVKFKSILKKGLGGIVMQYQEISTEKPSFWQLVFQQSKVNGATYMGEKLPGYNWNWPRDTYFQRRLRQARSSRFCGSTELN